MPGAGELPRVLALAIPNAMLHRQREIRFIVNRQRGPGDGAAGHEFADEGAPAPPFLTDAAADVKAEIYFLHR